MPAIETRPGRLRCSSRSPDCRSPREELTPELGDALACDTEGEWLNLWASRSTVRRTPPSSSCRRSTPWIRWSCDATCSGALWCTLAGIDDLEAAAEGDHSASARLPHTSGTTAATRARRSASCSLDPVETRDRIADAIAAGLGSLVEPAAADHLRAAGETARTTVEADAGAPQSSASRPGYRYVPEPEAERVVLIPTSSPRFHSCSHSIGRHG